MSKLILTSAFLIFAFRSVADVLPHGYQSYRFVATNQVDSIVVIESDYPDFSKLDTVALNPRFKIVQCRSNNCQTDVHGNKRYQQLIIYVSGTEYRSNIYEPLGSNPTFEVQESDAGFKVIETTSFLFKGKLGEITRALLITVTLELLVSFLFFGIRNNSRIFIIIGLINLLTIPLAWLTFPLLLNLWDSVVVLTLVYEVLVVIIEYAGLKLAIRNYSNGRVLGFAIIGNLVSFVLGGILFVVTIYM